MPAETADQTKPRAISPPGRIATFARGCFKGFLLVYSLGWITFDYLLIVRGRPKLRAGWLQRSAKRLAGAIGLKVEWSGPVPLKGMLVCNHVSYLDILALGSIRPLVFVSKADVIRWPVFGILTRWAGTIYVERERRSDVGRVNELVGERLGQGAVVAIFPEGTSSDGSTVLPFRSSLLEPAAGRSVAAAWIGYQMADGDPGQDAAYWGDMVFGPHLLKLLGKGEVRCRVAFGEAAKSEAPRKELALALHEQVCSLARAHGWEAKK